VVLAASKRTDDVRILLLTRYAALGASSRIRCFQYLPLLRQAGIEVDAVPLLPDEYLIDRYKGRAQKWSSLVRSYTKRCGVLLSSRRYDVLWVEYELFPWLPAWFEVVLAACGTKYVVEYDDAIFHRYDLHPKFVVRVTLGRKIDAVMRQAAAVVVGNEYLRQRAAQVGASHIEVIPSVVDIDRYPPETPPSTSGTTIGWIGSPATAHYLSIVRPALQALHQRGEVRLILVGVATNPLPGLPIDTRPWSESTEVDSIRQFDIGIMPLSDGAWERGKCGYKLIQYMACQKPVVASPVGANRQIVEHAVTGFLAEDDVGWSRALMRLINDPGLRARLGAAGRARVEREYSLQVTGARLVSLFKGLGPSNVRNRGKN
jgi:glycosyltransferase involved in cell wall biosynthesis